jgi:hypothetical protein
MVPSWALGGLSIPTAGTNTHPLALLTVRELAAPRIIVRRHK